MVVDEFHQPISFDLAPSDSVCLWCGKPAVRQIIAIGGKSHSQRGYFCSSCGICFSEHIVRAFKSTHLLHVSSPDTLDDVWTV